MSGIHSYLKEARIDKGLPQEEVAEMYEVSIENLLYGKKDVIERRRVTRIAIFVAAAFLLLQILTGLFSVLSFVLYPIEEGSVSAHQMEVVERHFEMEKISENTERIAASMLWLGSLVAVAHDLVKKPAFSWKSKVIFYFIVLGISWGIAVFFGIIHPAFGVIDFVTRGPIHFAGVTILLLVDLVLLNLRKNTDI